MTMRKYKTKEENSISKYITCTMCGLRADYSKIIEKMVQQGCNKKYQEG